MLHVLIIEDQILIALQLLELFSDCGYHSAEIANSEEQAIKLAEKRHPDLISTDHFLELGSGLAAVLHICRNRATAVVFITAHPQAVLAIIPDAVTLAKPFDYRVMPGAIELAIERARTFPRRISLPEA